MVGPIYMLVVRDLQLLSYFSMDIDIPYIKLKLDIRAVFSGIWALVFHDNLL